MQATAKAELYEAEAIDTQPAPFLRDMAPEERLLVLAGAEGDITPILTDSEIVAIGAKCLEDYQADCEERSEWEEQVKEAFKRAAQEKLGKKDWPWPGASNVNYPLLTTAALQFAARAYPAIVKGDEAVNCKVVGRDVGQPALDPMGNPIPQMQNTPEGPQPVMGPNGPEPQWKVPPGAKTARADRVKEYLNTTIFYRIVGWEEDTDALLHQLPIAGCAFRKVWPTPEGQRMALVSALKLVVPMGAKDCSTASRLTEVREDQSLNDIIGLQRAGVYRDVTLVDDEKDTAGRKLLEQHCLIDLDDDGYAEPYIVTMDEASSEVLRIEPNFQPQDVKLNELGEVVEIRRRQYYVKYDFFPNIEGKFYGIGLGHLLEQIGDIVNRAINQMIDAGTAQAAGGGFIASGVNLQGAGKRSGNLYFKPGEYKTVNTGAADLRAGIYERTFPGPSPIMYQILDMMLGAAKDISSVKDVLTGEASNNGQVGTTLALIEQGLQVFTAIYKRIYRSLKTEFSMLFTNLAQYGGEAAARDYLTVLDDPEADFAADFNQTDLDIRPVSDPASVTKLQKMARAQFLMTFVSAPGVNPQAIYKRAWEAADIDDIDELLMPPAPPPQPDPKDVASATLDMERAETEKVKRAELQAEIDGKSLDNLAKSFSTGMQMGMA